MFRIVDNEDVQDADCSSARGPFGGRGARDAAGLLHLEGPRRW